MTDDRKKTHLIVTGRGGGDQVQADWSQTDSEQPDYIKNKPELATVATSGSYNDLTDKPTIPAQAQADWNETDTADPSYIQNKPTIPAAQVNADWNAVSGVAQILNKPTIPAAQIQSDWNQSDNTQPDYIKNKPTILTQWFGTQAEYDLIDPKDPNVIYNIEGSDNVQADWNQSDSSADDYIKNKPTIPAAQVNSDWNAVSGVAQILNKPIIPAAQVNSDWSSESGVTEIYNKPELLTEKLTFTLQGGSTVSMNVYYDPGNYFYVENLSGSTNNVMVQGNSNYPNIEVFYSTDRLSWTSMGTTGTTLLTYTIPAYSKVYFKATANGWYGNKFLFQKDVSIGGNIMSLLYGDDFADKTSFATNDQNTFWMIFNNNYTLKYAHKLVLPATTLATQCYYQMFSDCQGLITAPRILPATTLKTSCYSSMFRDCRALTTVPILPATTLEQYCYSQMFSLCTSLTTLPTDMLPATTLASYCYNQMFSNCSALTTAPALPATTLQLYCYQQMFNSCRALTTAPVLPATTLKMGCYMMMFSNCSSLNSVTTYANNISANQSLNNWLSDVSATGDFYNLGGATYTSDANGIPSGWTEHTSL